MRHPRQRPVIHPPLITLWLRWVAGLAGVSRVGTPASPTMPSCAVSYRCQSGRGNGATVQQRRGLRASWVATRRATRAGSAGTARGSQLRARGGTGRARQAAVGCAPIKGHPLHVRSHLLCALRYRFPPASQSAIGKKTKNQATEKNKIRWTYGFRFGYWDFVR
jgi:hypothetical protein